MGKLARVRVENRVTDPNASFGERKKAAEDMRGLFRKRVKELGIIAAYKRSLVYESKSQKRRRKQKEAEVRRKSEMRDKLRDHFG